MNEEAGNEWRKLDPAKWKSQVDSILYTATCGYLEAWEIRGHIAYVLEQIEKANAAEIERLKAENERLEKVAKQMQALTGMKRYAITSEPNFIAAYKVQMQHIDSVPELAAWLKEKENE